MSDAGGVAGPVSDENRVHIFDTTLRDGEQSPGISLNTQEKVEIAQQLARLGVDVIEAGFPITSPGDFEAVEAIARNVEGPVICGLSRTHKADIDAAWNAIKDSERPRIHTFISTSDIHITHQLRTTREDVKGQAKAAVALAKSYCDDVEFSPMDATRADLEFTAEVCAIAVAEGANVINIPDTVGYTTPGEYAAYFDELYELVPGLDKVEVSVHCHDDLGLAVSNSYAGLLAGARQVECAVNGIGERAGNCSLEEIVMLLRTRRDVHGLDTGVDTRELARTSRMVSRLTGYSVPPNKAVVGRNAFAHESGIHQDGVLKERSTYEIMDATEVGLESNSIVLGKHSGRHALQDALRAARLQGRGRRAQPGVQALQGDRGQEEAGDRARPGGDRLRRDARERRGLQPRLVRGRGRLGARARRRAVSVVLPSGEESVAQASGDGPVDAIFGAIREATGTDAELQRYEVEAVTGGTDALGEVSVSVRANGRLASGQGVATDILEASARAFVRAISNALEGVAIREAEEATADRRRGAHAGPVGDADRLAGP